MGRNLSVVGAGVLAGTLATLGMSTLMLASKKLGIQGEHPPKKITRAALEAVGAEEPGSTKLHALSAATHLGFGAAAGGAFALAQQQLGLKRLSVLQGMVYGFLVWLVSYKGWVPGMGIMPPPERDHPGRVSTMIAAHLVYGAALGACLPARSASEVLNLRTLGRRLPRPLASLVGAS